VAELTVRVRTPARLHLGLIDLHGGLGRAFGSIGVAIDRPATVISVVRNEEVEISGPYAPWVRELVARFLKAYRVGGGCRVLVEEAIPRHVGLGSGTQMSLAVGVALTKLHNLDLSIESLALTMGRGTVSSVGVGAFRWGGFICDGGHRVDHRGVVKAERGVLPPILFHHPLPEEWRFVVAVPKEGQGLSGPQEKQAFEALPKPPERLVERMARLILVRMLPGLVEGDIEAFGEALTEVQRLTGEVFKPLQGGTYRSRLVEEGVNLMLRSGAYGAGQSSWGPTFYGLTVGDRASRSLEEEVAAFLEERGGGPVYTAQPCNKGAVVSISGG
jgi:beta-RFAP synthase